MRTPQKILEAQEAVIVEGYRTVRTRYVGDNMLLLLGEEGTHAKEFVVETKEWLSKFFGAFEPWKSNIILGNRFVWLRCIRLALNV